MSFSPVPGKMPGIPDEVLKELSRDQNLAYRWGHAIQSGQCREMHDRFFLIFIVRYCP